MKPGRIEIPIDAEALRHMYCVERAPIYAIARHFKMSKATLYKKLKQLGISRPTFVSDMPGHTACPTCGKSTMRYAHGRYNRGRMK